jgi:hypothetical protein
MDDDFRELEPHISDHPDEEAGPAGSRERAAYGGKEGSVGGLEPRPWNLAAQHGQLVTEHQNLQVLGSIAAGEQDEQLEGAAQREVDGFRKHAEAGLPSMAAGRSPYRAIGCDPAAQRPRPTLRTLQAAVDSDPAPKGRKMP